MTVRAASRAPWHPGRCAEILVGDAVLGHAGELHPRVCTAYGVPARTAAAEIDLTRLLEHAVMIVGAPEFSDFPVAKEDVALVVDDSVTAADVEAALREGAGEYLESVRLFDVYTGPQVGEGKKSLAFALRFRAPDRTLTEHEAGAARDAAVAVRPRGAARSSDERVGASVQRVSGAGSATYDRLGVQQSDAPSNGSRQLIGWWITRRKWSTIMRSPARWIESPSPRRQSRASITPAGAEITASGSVPGSATTWMSSSS